MIEKAYTAHATASGGRNGSVESSDGVLKLQVRMPKELGGPGGAFTNPEQLFAAGYSACFDSALALVARKAKASIGATRITADVSIGGNGKGGFGLSVELHANVPGVSLEQAEALVNEAHQVCPYSNAIRGNVDVALKVTNTPE